MAKVCIDPGHGGYDPGAVGNGLQEKDITRDIALSLRSLLLFNGLEVVMTREGDYAPGRLEGDLNGELRARVNIANTAKADLFVSVHVNSSAGANVGTGVEVLISGFGGQAEIAANRVLPYLVQTGSWANRGVKEQNVLVLRETNIPAILTENGFINTAADANKLRETGFRESLAAAHAQGICDFFGLKYNEKGEEERDVVLGHAIVYYTDRDFSLARMVSDRLSGCAMFCRNGTETIHPEAMAAKHLVIVGGPECTERANVTNCCGWTAADTAILAAEYVKMLP